MAITKLQAGPKGTVGNSTGTEIADTVNGLASSIPVAAGRLLSKLINNTSDATILVDSDSTGNETFEWVYLYINWLADTYPEFTVKYYLWDNTIGEYSAAEEISEGTGTHTLSLYNAAVPGSKPDFILGDKFENGVLALPQIDLFIVNQGHNGINAHDGTYYGFNRVPQFLELIESVVRVHEGCGVIMIAQNPRRDTDIYDDVYNAIIETCGLVGADVADVYSLFQEEGRNPDLYADDVHPSALGSELYLQAVQAVHSSKSFLSSICSLHDSGVNLIRNGDFSDFTGALPDDWTGSNATCTKETTIKDSKHAYAVRVAPTTSGTKSSISQPMWGSVLATLKGKWITLAVREYVPEVNDSQSAGRVAISATGDFFSSTYRSSVGDLNPVNGWRWSFLSFYVAPSVTALTVFIHGDSSTTDGECIFDRVSLVEGRLPKDLV